jgi:hypothetical protein
MAMGTQVSGVLGRARTFIAGQPRARQARNWAAGATTRTTRGSTSTAGGAIFRPKTSLSTGTTFGGGLTREAKIGAGVAGAGAAGAAGYGLTRGDDVNKNLDVSDAFLEDYAIAKAEKGGDLSGKEKAALTAGVIGAGQVGGYAGQARAVGGVRRAVAMQRSAYRGNAANWRILQGKPLKVGDSTRFNANNARANKMMYAIADDSSARGVGRAVMGGMNSSQRKMFRGGMKGAAVGYGVGALGAGAYVANRKVNKALDVSDAFVEDYEVAKAEKAKKSKGNPTAGRVVTGAVLTPYHGLVAGRKGKKLHAAGSQFAGGFGGCRSQAARRGCQDRVECRCARRWWRRNHLRQPQGLLQGPGQGLIMATTKPHPYREDVTYYAGKNLTLHAVDYAPGDAIPREAIEQVLRVRSLIDSRRIIAVTPGTALKNWEKRVIERGQPEPKPEPKTPPSLPLKKTAAKKASPAKEARGDLHLHLPWRHRHLHGSVQHRGHRRGPGDLPGRGNPVPYRQVVAKERLPDLHFIDGCPCGGRQVRWRDRRFR